MTDGLLLDRVFRLSGHAVQAGSAVGGTKPPPALFGPVAVDPPTLTGFILGCALAIAMIIAGVLP